MKKDFEYTSYNFSGLDNFKDSPEFIPNQDRNKNGRPDRLEELIFALKKCWPF
jgi:hypothetical protein